MQAINVVVLNRWFLGTFLGTAILCAVAMIGAILRWQMPNADLSRCWQRALLGG